MSTLPPLIRVCRKRTADPHSALLVSVKRGRVDGGEGGLDPLLFSLCATQDSPNVPENIRVIDYSQVRPPVDETASFSNVLVQQIDETEQPLALFQNSIGEASSSRHVAPQDVITCNGVPMLRMGPNENDIVYDFYEMRKGDADAAFQETDFEMRFMSQEEFNLWMESGSDSDDNCADDDEDSNDENNWRNEYPEEESQSDEDDDTYSDGEPDEWDAIGMQRLRIRDDDHHDHDVDTDEDDEDEY
ncbi:unnamed protein product, partial [Mesorhabditis belari]|uniref:Probable RNA polymerase II nuclear localization protein SLC7A6OS n=1 Tax=Mesorhabditis belari TaxID=2138241 RepID=A0AAF3F409_9BILA